MSEIEIKQLDQKRKKYLILGGILFGSIFWMPILAIVLESVSDFSPMDYDWFFLAVFLPMLIGTILLILSIRMNKRILHLQEEEKRRKRDQWKEKRHREENERLAKEREFEEKKKQEKLERERLLVEKKREVLASLSSIWPYEDCRKLALLHEYQEDEDNCRLVWVEVDYQAKVVIRADAFSWIATVKPSGLYAMHNEEVIILTKDYFQWHKDKYSIVNDGPLLRSYEMLQSIKSTSFVDANIDTSNTDLLDIVPHLHFSFDSGVFKCVEKDIPEIVTDAYFKVMYQNDSVVFSPICLKAYQSTSMFPEVVAALPLYLSDYTDAELKEATREFITKAYDTMDKLLHTLKDNNEDIDYNNVNLNLDSSLDCTNAFIHIDLAMGIINKLLCGEDILKWNPRKCEIKNGNTEFTFSAYVDTPRLSDYNTEDFVENQQYLALLQLLQGILKAAVALTLKVVHSENNSFTISYNVEKGEDVERVEYVSIK